MSVTIYDIAKKADVSIATVSRVLNNRARVAEATRQRVFEVAEQLGYRPHVSAKNLAGGKVDVVAAVIPMMTNHFFMEVMRGLQDQLVATDFDLLVYSAPTYDDVEGQLERSLQRGRSAGVLLFSTPLDRSLERMLRRRSVPVVLVDEFHPDFDSISVDNTRGGYLATRHLLNCGYRRVGLILANLVSTPATARWAGYEQALQDAGLRVEGDLVVTHQELDRHGYTGRAGYLAMQQMLARKPYPEAVFVASDIQALGALKAAEEARLRVPEDVAILGFDDIDVSQYVGLSTLHQPMYEMGRVAVEKLMARIEHPGGPVSHTTFSPSLVVRRTCGGQIRQKGGEGDGPQG